MCTYMNLNRVTILSQLDIIYHKIKSPVPVMYNFVGLFWTMCHWSKGKYKPLLKYNRPFPKLWIMKLLLSLLTNTANHSNDLFQDILFPCWYKLYINFRLHNYWIYGSFYETQTIPDVAKVTKNLKLD